MIRLWVVIRVVDGVALEAVIEAAEELMRLVASEEAIEDVATHRS
jgi:hypothetical protein